jgi:hypothetical protein
MILEFKSDKKLRDKWFVPEHFSHPAKMMLPLLTWIVENYTKGSADLIITPELLYDMDKEIDWCDCDKSDM